MISTEFDKADPHAHTSFYDAYAPKLWGIILSAKLSGPESETILINTLTKAWQQFEPHQITEKQFLSRLLILACREGLPIACVKGILKSKGV